ncbi:MAG TPA: hypothetical protein VLX64_03875 [Thermoplasmata archaeon]|nr:hypothetical protein [Thermoplasmata archaeon]HUJ78127.1 hypothetical protein [Thermoplasmata archaeon]
MGELSDALAAAARQLEARLAAHRDEMTGAGPGELFPQSWRFQTESESAVLRIAADGSVSVQADAIEPPTVIVAWEQRRLVRALLSGRSNEEDRPQPPSIRFTSDRGRRAFSLLGTSLGL